MPLLRVLLLADTHVGLDMPARPRIQRRRRGADFVANYHLAVEPAFERPRELDLVVHGGDLLDRSEVPPEQVQTAMAPLMRAAAAGVPVVLVPGNHERSRIPLPLLAHHPSIHILHQPRTVVLESRGLRVAVGGWPYRPDVRARFASLVQSTGLLDTPADVRLLCLHQAVEGARVAAHDFVFRRGRDVIRCGDLPDTIAAILSGHIHRAQVLRSDLHRRPLPTNVVYPGAVERTAFAERLEPKGYAVLLFEPDERGGRLVSRRFVELPARPMVVLDLCHLQTTQAIITAIKNQLNQSHPSAVIQVRLDPSTQVSAAAIRRLAPSTINIELSYPTLRKKRRTAERASG
jgi:DNA repair exonuclease SbcCD nuclease subunit